MNYCIENFKDRFLRVQFDDLLINQNNDLVNSDVHYLDVKNKYLQKSNMNCENLTKLYNEYNKLNNNYCCDPGIGRYVYRYVKSSDTDSVNSQIKAILHEQSKIFTEFTHYISILNNQPQNTHFNILKSSNQMQSSNARTTKLSSR